MLYTEYVLERFLTNLSVNGDTGMGTKVLSSDWTDKGFTDWSVPTNKGDFFESKLTANEVCELLEAIGCDVLCIVTSSENFVILTLEGNT